MMPDRKDSGAQSQASRLSSTMEIKVEVKQLNPYLSARSYSTAPQWWESLGVGGDANPREIVVAPMKIGLESGLLAMTIKSPQGRFYYVHQDLFTILSPPRFSRGTWTKLTFLN